ncbi:hypothetical protein GQ457_10G016810 [Hibiscus cannabinus]
MITIQPSFVLLLSLAFLHFKPSFIPTPNQTLTRNGTLNRTTRSNYIIRFTEYKPASDHRSYLESSLRSDGWEWIERRNPAARFPTTDFGMLSIEDSMKEVLIGEIVKLGFVKDVNVDEL